MWEDGDTRLLLVLATAAPAPRGHPNCRSKTLLGAPITVRFFGSVFNAQSVTQTPYSRLHVPMAAAADDSGAFISGRLSIIIEIRC